jgi:hypothetical protein
VVEDEKATLTDWVWVQVMVMQAMVGALRPEVIAVGLSERPGEWVVTFFLRGEVSEDVRRDLIESGGDAASYLDACDVEVIHASNAIRRPVRSEIVDDAPPSLGLLAAKVDRLLLAMSSE